MTLIKLFEGDDWASASEAGDITVDRLPGIGDTLAVLDGDDWRVAVVRGIVHRVVDRDVDPDIALLLTPAATVRDDGAPLPLAALDRVRSGTSATAPSTVSPAGQRGPWGSSAR